MGATLLEAFMPETTERILAQLNAEKRTLEDLKTFGLYPSGNKVTEKPEILFARLDLKEVLAKVEELQKENNCNQPYFLSRRAVGCSLLRVS